MTLPLLLEARDIGKVYPGGTLANDGVNLRVEAGQVHAIVGENGAGKSTLMKILFGLERPDRGEVLWKGRPVRWTSPRQAIAAGVGMVFQHFSLVPSLSVAENVVLGSEPRRGPGGLVLDRKAAVDQVGELATRFGLKVDPSARVSSLPVGQQQRVEILKALYRDAELLILDEPTAVLTPQEVLELFSAVRALVSSGKTVLFIAHKLPEVLSLSDTLTVLRAGRVVGSLRTAQASEQGLTRMMVGRDVLLEVDRSPRRATRPVLELSRVSAASDLGLPAVKGVTLTVNAGEILGLAGVEGNGQAELLEVIVGLRALEGGRVRLNTEDISACTPRQRRQKGVSSIPEDRLTRGLALEASLSENLLATRLDDPRFVKRGLLQGRAIRGSARELIARYGIRAASERALAASLSGGNMQKVVVARELAVTPKLLCVAQPTRGVDIGATEFIWQKLLEARGAGAALVLTSADLSELLALSDRIAVFYRGEVVALFEDPRTVSAETLGAYMLGLKRQESQGGALETSPETLPETLEVPRA